MADLTASHASPHEENPTVHHEQTDVSLGGILAFAAGLLVVGIVVHLLVWVLFRYFDAREGHYQAAAEFPLATQQESRLPPEPRLQTNPREDLREMRAAEDETLTSYGWVDRSNGIVRIPIDEAMKLVVQRGLPARTEQGR
jgi:hypothetical protein